MKKGSFLTVILTSCLTVLLGLGTPTSTLAKTVPPGADNTNRLKNPMALLQPVVLPDVPNISDATFFDVDAGSTFVCGIHDKDRTLQCWGRNDQGQLSPPSGRFTSLSLGQDHGCAIREKTHDLACWGETDAFGTAENMKGRYHAVSSGDQHTCAIRSNGKLVCWGQNDMGQLEAPSGSFKSVAAWAGHTCAISRGGKLACWGDPLFVGQSLPKGTFKQVVTGRLFGCAIRRGNGAPVCWGNNLDGQNDPPPGVFRQLAAGNFHACGITQGHKVYCQGEDAFGQVAWAKQAEPNLKKVVAGGEVSCALSLEGQLNCHGSYAHNKLLFENAYSKTGQIQSGSDGVQPRFLSFVLDLVGPVVALTGTTLVNYGKSVDKKASKQLEGKFANWQSGLAGVGLLVGAIIGGGAAGPSPELLAIEALQKDVEALKNAVAEVDKSLFDLATLNQTMHCDNQVNSISNDIAAIKTVKEAYQVLYNTRIAPTITSAADPNKTTPVADVIQGPGGINEFMATHYANLQTAINHLQLETAATPAVVACRGKSITTHINSNPQHPFDDRNIYKVVYQILGDIIAWQVEGLQMRLDMNLFKALQELKDPNILPDQPVVKMDITQLDGICGMIFDNRSNPNRRYAAAYTYCQENDKAIEDTYVSLVKEVENAGAPYSDETLMVSLAGGLWAKIDWPDAVKNNATNWLWLRDINLIPNNHWMFHGITTKGVGSWNTVLTNTLFDYYRYYGGGWDLTGITIDLQSVWHSDAQAWLDVFESTDARRAANNVKGTNDLIKDMSTQWTDQFGTPSGTPLFKNVQGRVFWLTGQTFEWNYAAMAPPRSTSNPWNFTEGSCSFITRQSEPARCFAGSEFGRVCGVEDEIKLFQLENTIVFTTPTCYTNGKLDIFTSKPGYWTSQVGTAKMEVIWQGGGDSRIKELVTITGSWFTQQPDKQLDMIPVLDLTNRICLSRKLKNGAPRTPTLPVAGGTYPAMPTRCGSDMDEVIDYLVPRPELPDVSTLLNR